MAPGRFLYSFYTAVFAYILSMMNSYAGTCNYKKGDGVNQGNYYLSRGTDVIPCNIPNDDKTCITGDIVMPLNTPMYCDSNGWQVVDIQSLEKNCDENKYKGYKTISTDVATFYYKQVNGSAKISDLHGCERKQNKWTTKDYRDAIDTDAQLFRTRRL